MLYKARHSRVPFDKSKGPCQKTLFRYAGRILQAWWIYNTTDDCLVLRLNDFSRLTVLITTKIVQDGYYLVRDSSGVFMFGLYVYDVSNIYDPVVWIYDESDLEYVVNG